jgi:hypothetical protein
LENGVPVVLKVQDVIVGLIFSLDIGETLGRQKTKVVVFLLVALYQNALSKSKVSVCIGF